MKTNESGPIGPHGGESDMFKLAEAGVFPRYVRDAWKKANWFDPVWGHKWLEKRGSLGDIRVGLLAMMLLGIMSLVAALTGKVSSPTEERVDSVLGGLDAIACFIAIGSLGRLYDRFIGRFQGAMYRLLLSHPMTKGQFPADEAGLKRLFLWLIEDLARMTLLLEKGELYEGAYMAREEARSLFEAACWFGFVKKHDRKKGLGPAFRAAEDDPMGFKAIDPQSWVNKCLHRLQNPVPYGCSRALTPEEVVWLERQSN
ncbi:MAG: hypothetical protein KGI69_01810 [Patescibacteria group bacterium]|nr:hypothetical protein [Patescibacteria group bacterium]